MDKITHSRKYHTVWLESTHEPHPLTNMPRLKYTLWGNRHAGYGKKCIDIFYYEKDALKALAAWEKTL